MGLTNKNKFFKPIDNLEIWNNLTAEILIANKKELCDKYRDYLFDLDLVNAKKSSSLMLYPNLK